MSKPYEASLLICICCGFGILITLVVSFFSSPPEQPLPTIKEVQQRLGCEKIDGILGDETQTLWDLYECDQAARVWLNADTMREAK